MADFSNYLGRQGSRGLLHPAGSTPLGNLLTLSALGFSITASVWTANRAVYLPVVCEEPVTVTDMAVTVVTQAGNLDVGIYDWLGNRLVSSGSTGVAAAGVQVIGIADTLLSPGWYYLALCCDSSTAIFRSTTLGTGLARICGLQQQSVGAVTLPNPATFATYATAVAPLVVASYNATF